MNVEPTRANYTRLSEALKDRYQQNPDDGAVALAYAEKLVQLGDMQEATDILAPMLQGETPPPQAIYLSAQIAYIGGKYAEAERFYQTLLNDHPDYTAKAKLGLKYVYYQTNQYQKAQAVTDAGESGMGDMMRAFGGKEPYKVNWADREEAVIPFVVTDPLPVIPVEVNGKRLRLIVDTGAGETYLNESAAQAMGIDPVATEVGEYAGDVTVETKYGIVDSMRLDNVTLESVPVHIADTSAFSNLYDFDVDGVIGTGVFRQFHVTMDYLSGALILKPRGLQTEIESVVAEMPFTIAGTHFLHCKAFVNDKEMNLFLDSGLATESSLLLPRGSMEYAGIPIPETHPEDGVGGLGGNGYEMGYFTVDTFKMGNLPTVSEMQGEYGIFPEGAYYDDEIGTFEDGIISHTYLKNYIWTIDFDTMTMTFSQ